jgi:hypothetical protein
MKKYSKKWKEDNKGYHSLYNKENAKKIAERKRIRYSEDLDFKIRDKLRTRLYQAIKFNKGGSAVKDLGCSIEELKKHIESQFTEGMNWDNYGEWHIDHIVPLSFFKLDNPIELRSACHYTNLQPLWATDNLKKGAIVK